MLKFIKYTRYGGREVYTAKWLNDAMMVVGGGFILLGVYNGVNFIGQLYDSSSSLYQLNIKPVDIAHYLTSSIGGIYLGTYIFKKAQKEKKRIEKLEAILGRELNADDYRSMYS